MRLVVAKARAPPQKAPIREAPMRAAQGRAPYRRQIGQAALMARETAHVHEVEICRRRRQDS